MSSKTITIIAWSAHHIFNTNITYLMLSSSYIYFTVKMCVHNIYKYYYCCNRVFFFVILLLFLRARLDLSRGINTQNSAIKQSLVWSASDKKIYINFMQGIIDFGKHIEFLPWIWMQKIIKFTNIILSYCTSYIWRQLIRLNVFEMSCVCDALFIPRPRG